MIEITSITNPLQTQNMIHMQTRRNSSSKQKMENNYAKPCAKKLA
jgi:hypothetical protein